jgi:hypothetical protein
MNTNSNFEMYMWGCYLISTNERLGFRFTPKLDTQLNNLVADFREAMVGRYES